jgi:molecular chaperone DnaJ
MSTKRDYYETLGVAKNTNPADLKKAYHSMAKKYHPDLNSGDKVAERKLQEVNEAYEVLNDPQKRAAYDRFGHNANQPGMGPQGGGGGFHHAGSHADININDIFGDFFGEFMGGGRGQRSSASSQVRGSDLRYNIVITLEEAFSGAQKNINFVSETKCNPCNGTGSADSSHPVTCDGCNGHGVVRMQQGFFAVEQTCRKCMGAGQIVKNPCKKCAGQGRLSGTKNLRVDIPAGIENNTTIKLNGEGEAGLRGGSSGSLHVVVTVKPHDVFKTDGADLHCKLPISFVKAALGGDVEIPTIGRESVLLKIPAATQNGDQLRLKDKGMTKIRSSVRGDLYAHVHIMTPKNLTKKQKDALELFGQEMGEDVGGVDSNFFDKMKNIWS